MRHAVRALLLCVGAGAFGGCAATKASIQLVNAEQALTRAEGYEANNKATYEYTMALRYLEKAREEAGHSEFRISDALSRQSAEWSDRAIIFIEKRGKADINLDDFSNIPETVVPPPPPPPEPAEDLDPMFEPSTEGIPGEGEEKPETAWEEPPPAPAPEPEPADDDDWLNSDDDDPPPPKPKPEPEPEEESDDDWLESDDDEVEIAP